MLKLRKLRAYFTKKKLDSATQHKISTLEQIIGDSIQNPNIYLRALRHRSKLIEDGLEDVESYEQLEFLGDAVLDLVITEILFELYPNNNEGFMTKVRSRLVREDTLADLSRKLGFPSLIEVGKRVRGQGIELKNSVLCDIFEAVVGAVYKDLGFSASQTFIRNVYTTHINIKDVSVTQDNYKSMLLEFAQARKLSVPEYKIVSETGPDHDKTFEVNVLINGAVEGMGKAKNKKKAEQAAAKLALDKLNH
ncbi:ribonuclease III [Cyclonatronum proteinivorum]|nr:ribonuclease III [Cyclonatronum proteinivorum]